MRNLNLEFPKPCPIRVTPSATYHVGTLLLGAGEVGLGG